MGTPVQRVVKNCIIGLVSLLAVASQVSATVQRPDILFYDGVEHDLYEFPLEQFFKVHPEARIVSEVRWSNMWRGYVATFEIKDGTLFVRDIKIGVYSKGPEHFETEFVTVMATVFPDQREVLADWFTGHLVVPVGEEEDPYLYDAVHSKQIIYEVQAGKIIGKREMGKEEYIDFIIAQWEAFRREIECARVSNECRD